MSARNAHHHDPKHLPWKIPTVAFSLTLVFTLNSTTCTVDFSSDDQPPRTCGNGVIDQGEDCDGDNLGAMTCQVLGYSGGNIFCTGSCTIDNSGCTGGPGCGDGVQTDDEECDCGSTEDNRPATCKSPNTDDPDADCRLDCTLRRCGDGILDTLHEEECDDGDANSDSEPDACRTDCTLPFCGDGITDPSLGEECDDGNTSSGDGCTADCQNEACGNGVIDPGEGCDDGNQDITDACPDGPVGICQPARCGDGFVWSGHEGCDDGNLSTGDGCSSTCALEGCGNGVLEPGEACDDGNQDNTDACPDGPGGICLPARCGDGFVQTGVEACDDGNNLDCDGCKRDCSRPDKVCGDGILECGEACDDGNTANGDGCSSNCTPE